jgi:hypothetical protein
MCGFLCPDNGGGPGQRQRGEAQNTELKQKTSFSIGLTWSWISKFYLGSMSRDVHSCSHWLRPRSLPPPLAFGLVYEGRYWSAKIDEISNPLSFSHHHWLKRELYLQSLFGLLCTVVLIGWDSATPPLPPHFGSYTKGTIGQLRCRWHLLVTPRVLVTTTG